jgi:hypothetical protein
MSGSGDGALRPERSRPEAHPLGQRPAPVLPGGSSSQRTLVELSLVLCPKAEA